MELDPSQSLHNSNTISEPAAVAANPGHLMYSHTLHLTQGLSSGSYQYPTDTHTNYIYAHADTLFLSLDILSLNFLGALCSLHIKMPLSACS